MRILTLILMGVVAGTLVGGAVAYVEVRADRDAIAGVNGGKGAIKPLAPDAKVPKIEVDQVNFNFGSMQRGTTKSHEFIIRNVGNAPLKLEKGPSSCKCVLGEVAAGAIPPGELSHVKLEWSAKSDRGPFRQTATIMTNDPFHSQVELSIEGEILDASGVAPPDLMFDKIPYGESRTAEVYVMAMLQDELDVTDVQLSDVTTRDKFDVKVEPVERAALPDPAAKDGVRITVTAKPGLPVGRINQWVSLRTNLPEAEKLEIPVIGRIVGDISVHGTGWNEEEGMLTIGSVKSSEGRKAKVNVVVRGADAAGVKFEVQSVDPPELKVNIGESKQLKDTLLHVPVEIEVPVGTRPMVRLDTAQGEEAHIVLKTTHPKIKELVLGVRFAVER